MNPEVINQTASLPEDDGNVLKPKRKPLSDEARQKASERMKKVNAERIEKARIANEQVMSLQQERLKERIEKIEVRKPSKKGTKPDDPPPEAPPQEPAPFTSPVQQKRKKIKQIIIQESSSESESESEGESESEQVVYITKKTKKPAKEKESIVKQKNPPKKREAVIEPMKTVVKFF